MRASRKLHGATLVLHAATSFVLLSLVTASVSGQQQTPPACQAESGREARLVRGELSAGDTLIQTVGSSWIFRLAPRSTGWLLQVTVVGREAEDLSRLTPPWHSVPNPRQIEGWHFRNSENTGPNDGSVNAPQELRDFIFSPAVGRGIEYSGSATRTEDVEAVRAFGRGWLFVESYRLTPSARGDRAAFESLRFSACLTWPVGQQAVRHGRHGGSGTHIEKNRSVQHFR